MGFVDRFQKRLITEGIEMPAECRRHRENAQLILADQRNKRWPERLMLEIVEGMLSHVNAVLWGLCNSGSTVILRLFSLCVGRKVRFCV